MLIVKIEVSFLCVRRLGQKLEMENCPNENKIKKDYPDMEDKEYWEARQNLYGLFSILIEVDKRVNPQFYKRADKKEIKK